MDYINIKRLKIYAHHGVFEEEKKNGQYFYISAKLGVDTRIAGKSDNLIHSINYAKVCELINDIVTGNTFDLIETVAETIAEAILLTYDSILEVSIEVSKPSAPVGLPFEDISVSITRKWHTCYIALGSNLGDTKANLENAALKINSNRNFKDMLASTFISTKPYGYVDQPDFLNGVIKIKTLLTPFELLDYLHTLEEEAKRVREIHWGPRTLDLDILYYDDIILDDKNLTIPHTGIPNRDFVLKPLVEIAPSHLHPIKKLTSLEMLNQLNTNLN
ncbi:MAG: 2-amino-4-hydroxy-6-hydroxymethyldihydropteridine diphosphokinase [Clostridiales bacterium]|nr:2-amino-4-hydroxy-6-hydroxymethyldihydropteridine diphosphokinase [Clostridiales bacterium]